MTAKTHDAAAFAVLITAAVYFPPPNLKIATVLTALVANIVGALLPDIDQASNRLWDLLPGGNLVGRVLRRVLLSHRTLSHSILGIWGVYKLSLWLLPKWLNSSFVEIGIVWAALMIGYLSHLVLDGFTEEGLPLLWPIKWKFGLPPIAQWRIETGKWFEKYVVFWGIVMYTLIFLGRNFFRLAEMFKQ